jgi:glycosyltransferase involved in cell wall biosynthesis
MNDPPRQPVTTTRRSKTTHVVIATPLGEHGKGGIDRLMDMIRAYARAHPDPAFAFHFVTTRGKGSVLLSPLYLMSAALRLAWFKATGRADVLHVNIVQRGSAMRKLMLCGLARRLGIPYVLHLHGGRFGIYWDAVGSWLSARLAAAFNHAACTIVLGQVWARYISGRATRARIEIVPNATFAPRREPGDRSSEAPVHILFLGKIGANKGVPELLQALAMLPQDGAWRATLAGDGAVDAARSEVTRLELDRTVTVRGWAAPQEVDALLCGADVLVLPSHHECMPLSVIEGMAYGLAVVATPVGSVPEIIAPGETGLLCPPGDARSLAETLSLVISDSELRSRLGRAAQIFHREHLDAPPFVRRLKTIWEEAADTTAVFAAASGRGCANVELTKLVDQSGNR